MSNKPTRRPPASARVKAASGAGRGGSTLWVWAALVAVVVVIGVVAVVVSSSGSDDPAGGSASPSGGTVVPTGEVEDPTVTVTGEPLPSAPAAGGVDPAVGDALPTIEGQTFDGSAMTIAGGDGPQVVMAIAHWCPHCQREVPVLQGWLDDNGMPSDVALSAVATDNRSDRVNYPAGSWLRGEGWSVPTMVDDSQNAAAAALGVSGYPTFVAVGADGTVVARTSGEISLDTWEALLDAARSGQPPAA